MRRTDEILDAAKSARISRRMAKQSRAENRTTDGDAGASISRPPGKLLVGHSNRGREHRNADEETMMRISDKPQCQVAGEKGRPNLWMHCTAIMQTERALDLLICTNYFLLD